MENLLKSLGQLIDQTTPADPSSETGHWRSAYVYHGSADATWPLLTSLDRLGGVTPPHTKARLEAHILRHFLRYARPYLSRPIDEWELLMTAQHYGVPTRLLDWTYSPLIAAHFATAGQRRGSPAAIWQLDWRLVHKAFNFPELALLVTDLQQLFDDHGFFTPWQLFELQNHNRAFACLLEPPAFDLRLVAQSAAFTLCSDTRQPFDRFLAQQGLSGALTKYIIPAEEIERVRDQLDLVGIDERRLFPDLSGLASELRRYYG
jgi:FRG domain